MPRVISERRDAEELLFLSRFASPGVSQTNNGLLENGMHTQTVSWGVVIMCRYLDIWL